MLLYFWWNDTYSSDVPRRQFHSRVMEVETSTLESGVISVKLGGRLDFETTARLEGPVLLRAATTKAGVVIDLSKVEFIGSTGLRLLLKCAKGQHALGGKLVLCSPNPLVRQVLIVSGMPNAIPLYDTFDEAYRAVAGLRREWSGVLGTPGLGAATGGLQAGENSGARLAP